MYELFENEMKTDIKIERNNFKHLIKKIVEQIKAVTKKISQSVKTPQKKTTRNLQATTLENSMIFQIDDEIILSFDTPNMYGSIGTTTWVIPGSLILLSS